MKTLVTTAFVISLLAPSPLARGQSAIDPCVEGTSPQQMACDEDRYRILSVT